MTALKVGIREFREQLQHYVSNTGRPVEITRHGETLGYFIPSHRPAAKDDVAALRAAAAQLDELLKAAGASEDDLVAEFGRRPRNRRK